MKRMIKTDITEKLKKTKRSLRITKLALMAVILALSFATPVFTADPLAAINTLSTFIFSAIKAIGMII